MREAIVTFSDAQLEALGFGGLVSSLREARVRDVEMLEDRGATCVPQVEVEERIEVEELRTFECVDDVELVAEKDDTTSTSSNSPRRDFPGGPATITTR